MLTTNLSFQSSALLSDAQAQQQDGVLDYLTYGVAATVISGATGLANTVIGIGEMLGVADSSSYIDEGRAVTTFLGQEGGEFYLRHKTGIDFAGLIGSSLIPGIAGIRALRAAQKSGIIYDPLKYATSARNADILLDSPQVRAAADQVLRSGTTTMFSSPQYLQAIGAGAKQQVLEAVAFEAGMVLANNQNAALNPDDLSYLDAAGSQLWEGLPFVALGAGIGTAIDVLRMNGHIRKYAKAEHNRVVATTADGADITAGALRNLDLPEMQGRNAGDSLIFMATESRARTQMEKQLYVKDGAGAEFVPEDLKFAYNNIQDSKHILRQEFIKTVDAMNDAGPQGYRVLSEMFDGMANAQADMKYALAGMEKITPVRASALGDMPNVTTMTVRKQLDERAISLQGSDDAITAFMQAGDVGERLGVAARLMQVGNTAVRETADALLDKTYPVLGRLIKQDEVQRYGSKLGAVQSLMDELPARAKGAESKLVSASIEQLQVYVPSSRLTAFINASTKEVRTNINPSIADTASLKVIGSGKNAKLLDTRTGKQHTYNANIFKDLSKLAMGDSNKAVDVMDSSFVLAHKEKVSYAKDMQLSSFDVPKLERVYKDAMSTSGKDALHMIDSGKLRVDGSTMSLQGLGTLLVQRKAALLGELQSRGLDADAMAKSLNVNRSVVLGEEALTPSNVMARSSYDEPQWLQVEYRNRNIADYEKEVDQFVGQSHRDKLYQTQKAIALEELGYMPALRDLPTLDLAGIDKITQLDSRTGMFTRIDSDFGSVRETATYVGKQVNNIVRKLQTEVTDDFMGFERAFNAKDAGVLRAELELTTNFLRTGDKAYAARVPAIQALMEVAPEQAATYASRVFDIAEFNRVAAQVLESPATLRDISPEDFARVADALPESAFVEVSQKVGDVLNYWGRQQYTSARQRQVIAEALGTTRNVDEFVLRAPAVDLSQYRQVAFVRPVGGKAANDPTKYMIYAQSSEEMTERMNLVRQQLGDDYMVVQKGDDAEYFKAMQEYELGHEFRDLYADMSKQNRGRTADVLPPLGQDTSRALADMKRSTLRNKQYALRSSVELQNAEALEVLRRYGDFRDAPERGALTKNLTSRGSHIYTDTVALMLDLPSYKGQGNKLWNEVNTAVSQRGSKVVDWVSAQGTPIVDGIAKVKDILLRKERRPKEMVWDDRAMDELNGLLEKHKFSTPLRDVTDLLLQSSDPAISTTLDKLSRTMSNLMSLTMLRADPAHSFMQYSSSTILSLPVLREVRAAIPEVAERLTSVVNPVNGFKEPNVAKLYAKGLSRAFSRNPEHKEFMQQLKDRGIISDYIETFLDVTDMAQLSGNHTLDVVQRKLNQAAEFVSKYSGHKASEEHSRFALASAIKEMADARGIPLDKQWPIISNAVDKVHGNYVASQRPQLFNGAIGQSVGLFQTYFFNVMQHMTKHIADGNKKNLALMGGLQAGLFGARSIPGFDLLNSMVASKTNYESDLYDITDANNPDSWNAYAMWGLASQAFGVDFSGRGDLNPRYATIIPTDFQNLATVSMLTHAVSNLYNTAGMLADGNVSVGTALAHGLAHNGMNRPLQGIGTLMQDAVTSRTGQVDFAGTRLDEAGNIAWGSWVSRIIGARPMDEAIVRSHFYRQAAYDAAHRDKMAQLGAVLQAGGVEDWGQLATDYAAAGGNLQQFNSWTMRHMQTASEGKLAKFKREMNEDSQLSQAVSRMQYSASLQPYWNDGM